MIETGRGIGARSGENFVRGEARRGEASNRYEKTGRGGDKLESPKFPRVRIFLEKYFYKKLTNSITKIDMCHTCLCAAEPDSYNRLRYMVNSQPIVATI